jgi:hypothetical protein
MRAKPVPSSPRNLVRLSVRAFGQVALPDRVCGEEIADERVLDDLPHGIPVGLRDGRVEGGECGLRSLVQSAGHRRLQHTPGPPFIGGARTLR